MTIDDPLTQQISIKVLYEGVLVGEFIADIMVLWLPAPRIESG